MSGELVEAGIADNADDASRARCQTGETEETTEQNTTEEPNIKKFHEDQSQFLLFSPPKKEKNNSDLIPPLLGDCTRRTWFPFSKQRCIYMDKQRVSGWVS